MSYTEQIGFRNQLRSRWKALPERQRVAATLTFQLVVSILLGLLDHSLGYGVALLFTIFWLRRLAPMPWRLAIEAGLVAVFAIASAINGTHISVALLLLFAFLLTWVPKAHRRWAYPVIALAGAVIYPFLWRTCSRSRCSGSSPTSRRAPTWSCSS